MSWSARAELLVIHGGPGAWWPPWRPDRVGSTDAAEPGLDRRTSLYPSAGEVTRAINLGVCLDEFGTTVDDPSARNPPLDGGAPLQLLLPPTRLDRFDQNERGDSTIVAGIRQELRGWHFPAHRGGSQGGDHAGLSVIAAKFHPTATRRFPHPRGQGLRAKDALFWPLYPLPAAASLIQIWPHSERVRSNLPGIES